MVQTLPHSSFDLRLPLLILLAAFSGWLCGCGNKSSGMKSGVMAQRNDVLIEALKKSNDDLTTALKDVAWSIEFDDNKNVTLLDFTNRYITDEALLRIKELKSLKSLDLRHTQITDDGLRYLTGFGNLELLHVTGMSISSVELVNLKKSLPNCRIEFTFDPLLNAMLNAHDDLAVALKDVAERQSDQNVEVDAEGNVIVVDLRNTALTDASMDHFPELPRLQLLNLRNSRISEAGVEKIKDLINLEVLDLRNVVITDSGMEILHGLTKLTRLDLNGESISDSGLKSLDGFSHLRYLSLARVVESLPGLTPPESQITDAGMTHLLKLVQLQELDLTNSGITDSGLMQLAGLKQLKTIHLKGTGVSEEGGNKLKLALPNLTLVGLKPSRPRREERAPT